MGGTCTKEGTLTEKMPTFAQARALNASVNLTNKTALVVGGTSGLGQGIAERLAAMNATIIVSGRNKDAAAKIISQLHSSTESTDQHSFLPVDLSSIADISRFTTEFKAKGQKIDYLVITAGFMSVKGRDENAEGIDKKLCVHYYGRFKLIQDLMPLMQTWNTRVLSVLAAGKGGAIDVNNLDLKKNYSVLNAAIAAPQYNDLMVMVRQSDIYLTLKELGRRNEEMSFTHMYPGVVDTSLTNGLPFYLKYPAKALGALFGTSIQDFGDIAAYVLTSDKFKTGAHLLGELGDKIKLNAVNHSAENAKIVWTHSEEVVGNKL